MVCILTVSTYQISRTPNGEPETRKNGFQNFISSLLSDVEKSVEFNGKIIFQIRPKMVGNIARKPGQRHTKSTVMRHNSSYIQPGMGSRQFCRGRGRGQGREVEAEARQTKFEARPRRAE